MAGDETQKNRREQLVAEVRKDPVIPAAHRAEVVGLAENIAIGKRRNLPSDKRLEEYEKVARSLIAEFPDLPELYEALVHIAADSAPERAITLAQELVEGGAPDSVRTRARRLLERYALRGRLLAEIVGADLEQAGVASGPWENGLAIYTWSASNPHSISIVKQLLSALPEECLVVGVSLDEDLSNVAASAEAAQLPGIQLEAANRIIVANELILDGLGMVYLCDKEGVIRRVTAQRDIKMAVSEVLLK